MGEYLGDIWRAFSSILLGLGVTLRYCFAKTITSQYPDVPPSVQPSWRGIHWIELQKCIACEACAKICPVSCITVDKSKPRRFDKAKDVALGGAMLQYDVDYGKCIFCGLCVEVCPTSCLHMGEVHDLSCYSRADCVVHFVDLARIGRQTPEPLWTSRPAAPTWVQEQRVRLNDRAAPHRELMLKALEETAIPAAPKPAAKAEPGRPRPG
jgi:NADH-quinone oxidoreductase subunit I